MLNQIKVYGKKNCPQCHATKQLLDNNDIEYTFVDVEEDQEAFEYLVSLGINSLPVTEYTRSERVIGFKPVDLSCIIEEVKECN